MVEFERARRPFWIHQVVEYLVGLALISAAAQLADPAVPAVMGLVVLFVAAITRGAAGAFRLVSTATHRWLDVVLVVALVAAAIQPWFTVDANGRLLLVAIALVLAVVAFYTDYAPRPTRKERRAARARPGSEEVGKRAGRAVGQGVNTVKRWTASFGGDEESVESVESEEPDRRRGSGGGGGGGPAPANWDPPRPHD